MDLCFRGLFVSWHSASHYPALARAALWSEVVVAVVALTIIFSRWIGGWGLWSGVWIWWSLGALVVSIEVPGASYLWLIPVAAAPATGAAVQFSTLRVRPWANQAAIMVAALLAGLFWLKLALGMEDAMGLGFTPVITVPLALVIATMAPAWIPDRTPIIENNGSN